MGDESTLSLGGAFRDASVTVLAVCTEIGAGPQMIDGGELLHPVGFLLIQRSSGVVQWFLYPPSAGEVLSVLRDGRLEGVIRFGRPPSPGACPDFGGARTIRLLRCDALTIANWTVGVDISPLCVDVVDVVVTAGSEDRDRGFYLLGLDSAQGGLQVEFGFRSVSAGRISFRLREILMRDLPSRDCSLTGAVHEEATISLRG
jgi:hypothetical protein